MKETIGIDRFVEAFHHRRDNFTRGGLMALFEYLERYEEDCGIELELDVIALCCEYTEYETLYDFQQSYGESYETLEDIEDETVVIRVDDDSFIILDF